MTSQVNPKIHNTRVYPTKYIILNLSILILTNYVSHNYRELFPDT